MGETKFVVNYSFFFERSTHLHDLLDQIEHVNAHDGAQAFVNASIVIVRVVRTTVFMIVSTHECLQ